MVDALIPMPVGHGQAKVYERSIETQELAFGEALCQIFLNNTNICDL